MKPIEKARELAHCDTCDTCDNSNYLIPSKNCILKIDLSIAMQMHEWTKQQIVEKVTDFISQHFYISTSNHVISKKDYYSLTELIRDINQAMEE